MDFPAAKGHQLTGQLPEGEDLGQHQEPPPGQTSSLVPAPNLLFSCLPGDIWDVGFQVTPGEHPTPLAGSWGTEDSGGPKGTCFIVEGNSLLEAVLSQKPTWAPPFSTHPSSAPLFRFSTPQTPPLQDLSG